MRYLRQWRAKLARLMLLAAAWLSLLDALIRLQLLPQHAGRPLIRQWLQKPPVGRQWPYRRPSVQQIAQAVRMAARLTPGATCLPQALSAMRLLHWFSYPARLRIGVVSRPDQQLAAHAWVELAGAVVLGGDASTPLHFQMLHRRER